MNPMQGQRRRSRHPRVCGASHSASAGFICAQTRGKRRGPGAFRLVTGPLRLAHHFDPLLQQLIAARDDSGEGAADRDGGLDAHSVVGRTIFLPDVHSGPAQGVASSHVKRVYAAVGAGGGSAHEGAEVLGLDGSHQGLGEAQDAISTCSDRAQPAAGRCRLTMARDQVSGEGSRATRCCGERSSPRRSSRPARRRPWPARNARS